MIIASINYLILKQKENIMLINFFQIVCSIFNLTYGSFEEKLNKDNYFDVYYFINCPKNAKSFKECRLKKTEEFENTPFVISCSNYFKSKNGLF